VLSLDEVPCAGVLGHLDVQKTGYALHREVLGECPKSPVPHAVLGLWHFHTVPKAAPPPINRLPAHRKQ
jgi:hypothetical protein